jgi:hypothetical protein
MNKPRFVVKKTLIARAGLCAAAAAAVLVAGCSSPDRPGHPYKAAAAARPSPIPSSPPIPERPSKIKHWGSFFGGVKGINYDPHAAPAAMTVPGTVAQIGSSNSTEYALLTNGVLYAWGLARKANWATAPGTTRSGRRSACTSPGA